MLVRQPRSELGITNACRLNSPVNPPYEGSEHYQYQLLC